MQSAPDYAIGVDFDNTIVSYDDILLDEISRLAMLNAHTAKGKKSIRDAVRSRSGGELDWQRLQAAIYGPRMMEAKLIDGVFDFFNLCRRFGVRTYIISHKTEYAAMDRSGTNLRDAALTWMQAKGFFEPGEQRLLRKDVFFEPTRIQKIERIRLQKCTHFIDDLEETFLEESFPEGVNRILYMPHARTSNAPKDVKVASSWEEISRIVFPSLWTLRE